MPPTRDVQPEASPLLTKAKGLARPLPDNQAKSYGHFRFYAEIGESYGALV
jgi:hypothetical protein